MMKKKNTLNNEENMKRWKNNNKNERRGRSPDEEASGIDKLPYEIISKILAQLPITSVLQCRCVCKYWLTISRDPKFATAHFARSSSTNNTNPNIILCSGNHTTIPNKLYLLECDDFKTCREITWINTWFHSRRIRDFEIVGSFNGLICLFQNNRSVRGYVCNPITGECLSLPQQSTRLTATRILGGFLGFGFTSNSKTKEYKVVRILVFETPDDDSTHVDVYTLGSGYWRSKGSLRHDIYSQSSDVFVNGALHWISGGYDHSMCSEYIVSFDVGDEEFRVIPSPDFKRINSHVRNLAVTEGCLSICDYSYEGCIEIWVMKEYGVKESWSKVFVIPTPFDSITTCYTPLGIHRNGEPLLRHDSGKLITYNVEGHMFRDLEINGVPKFILEHTTYLGSLVTLESVCGGEMMSKRERSNLKGRTKRYVSIRRCSRLGQGIEGGEKERLKQV